MLILLGIMYGLMTIVIVALIFFVLYSKYQQKLNLYFAYFLIILAIWTLLSYASNLLFLSYDSLLLINRALLSFSSLLLLFLLLFCAELIEVRRKKILYRVILPIGVVGAILAYTPFVAKDIDIQRSVVGIHFGVLSIIYLCALTVMAGFVLWFLFSAVKKSDRVKKQQALIMLGSLCVSLFFIFVTNVILPFWQGDFTLSQFGPLFVILVLSATGYAIIRHRLFDIKSFAARTLAYVLSISTLIFLYAVIVIGLIDNLAGQQEIDSTLKVLYTITAVLLALTFHPIKQFFDKITDNIFFRDDYKREIVLDKIGEIISRESRIDPLTQKSIAILKGAFHAQFVCLAIFDDEKLLHYFSSPLKSKDMPAAVHDLGIAHDTHSIATINNSKASIRYKMSKLNVDAIAPLKLSDGLHGYMIFGIKQNGKTYSHKDFNLITIVSDEMGIATQNALRLKEIRHFNNTLQYKVDEATTELRSTNKKLHELDESKDEFISMASHQLRTPLTTVKGYLSMVLEGDVGEVTPAQRKVLEEAFGSAQRMVYLISDFLNVSRLQTGKFELELRPINIADILSQEISQLKDSATSRQMTLEYEQPARFPTVQLDENKIRQVIMNFIDNAVYYSHPGDTIRITLTQQNGEAIFKVKDHGIGVPIAERHRLFAKFYRATNAKKQRPDGTGIGLFMSRKVIVAHGGSIVFESTEGKGSTFGFRLPLEPRQKTE